MIGDITPYESNVVANYGSRIHQVAGNTGFPAINAGELVNKTLGNQYVITCPTNDQVVGTNYVAGISATTSTEGTTGTDGTVQVIPLSSKQIWLVKPTTSASWFGSGTTPSQSTYNALVGTRQLIAKSSSGNTGSYTIGDSDSATSGCVIENLDVVKYPGVVAFSFRDGLNYLT